MVRIHFCTHLSYAYLIFRENFNLSSGLKKAVEKKVFGRHSRHFFKIFFIFQILKSKTSLAVTFSKRFCYSDTPSESFMPFTIKNKKPFHPEQLFAFISTSRIRRELRQQIPTEYIDDTRSIFGSIDDTKTRKSRL